MKVIVIGCTHAGTAAILNTANLYDDVDITVYERNDNISFLSCGIALHVAEVVKDAKGLFYSSPEQLKDLGVATKMKHEVLKVDVENKNVQVKNLESNEVFTDEFDKLIVTSGSWPIVPPIDGIKKENIVLCKNYDHAKTIIEKAKEVEKVVVVGAGYIGVELVEAFEILGKEVTLIDAQDRILPKYLDPEFTQPAEAAFEERGVKLALGQLVNKFEGTDAVTAVVTDQGRYEADLVVLCIGFAPNTALVKGQVDMLPNGAIIIDEYMHTSHPDVFAAGDSCAVIYNPTGERAYIPLATNAVRMGTLVAKNLKKDTAKYMGTQGTSGIKIYNHNIASTGLTEVTAKDKGIEIESVLIKENWRPEFMPTYNEVTLKVVFDKESRVVLGAQLISDADLTQSINTMSVVIQNKMTIDELAYVDFFFQPHYNKPWNFLNTAGLNAK